MLSSKLKWLKIIDYTHHKRCRKINHMDPIKKFEVDLKTKILEPYQQGGFS